MIDQGFELLTTQLYLKDHPSNAQDFLFQRMTRDEQARVSLEINDLQQTSIRLVV